MAWFQALNDLNDWLVEQAEQVVREYPIGSGDDANEAYNTQLSRAIEVARSSQTTRVFLNWLRYQASRRQSGGQLWTIRSDNEQPPLVERLQLQVQGIAERVAELMPDSSEAQGQATMEAVVRFFGFLKRAVIGARYLQPTAGQRKG